MKLMLSFFVAYLIAVVGARFFCSRPEPVAPKGVPASPRAAG